MTDRELTELLSERLAHVRGRMTAASVRAGRDPAATTLIAVTKTVSIRVASLLPGLGVTDLGESRPQELWTRQPALPSVRWHLIGHLQRNKIDRTIPLVSRVHSVDSERLLKALHDFGMKRSVPVPILLEVNCSREEAKGGLTPESLPRVADTLMSLTGVQIDGLMTMAAYHDNPADCRPTFAELRTLRDQLRTQTGLKLPELSMGMSNDFEVAIEEGATMVRVGTTLFEGLEAE